MNKGKRVLQMLHHSKPLWAVFSLLFSFCLVVGSTYSWITDRDQRINQTTKSSEKLDIKLDEIFQMNLAFQPGMSTVKEVRVQNNWKTPAIVKVSLFEVFASFEVDVTDQIGNGNLKFYPKNNGGVLDKEDLKTWKVGNLYAVKNGFWKVKEAEVHDPGVPSQAYQYDKPRVGGLANLTINFNTEHLFTSNRLPPDGQKAYWFYDQGYFYYSDILNEGEKTIPLIKSVSLSENTPNRYKGSLYQLIPVADGHDTTKGLFKDWGIKSGPVHDLYSPLIGK